MTINVSCDECFNEYRLNDALAGKKVKCKECGAIIKVPKPESDDDDLDLFGDGDGSDDDDEDERPRRKSSKGAAAQSRGRSRREETPLPEPTKKSKKKKKSGGGGYHDPLDDVPTSVVLGIMWTVILVLCLLFWLLGFKSKDQIAQNFNQNPFQQLNANPAQPAIVQLGTTPTAPFALAGIPVPTLPDLPPLKPVAVPTPAQMAFVNFAPGGGPGTGQEVRIWMPQGNHVERSLGCIFMTKTTFSFVASETLSNFNNPQEVHGELPLLQTCLNAGYAVVAFSNDGEFQAPPNPTDNDAIYKQAADAAHLRFKASAAGLVNLRNAVEWVTNKVPMVNPQRLSVMGVGEGASFALLAAAHEGRLKGCMAIEPVCNLQQHYADLYDADDAEAEEAMKDKPFHNQCSPSGHVAQISCPVFICSFNYGADLLQENAGSLAENNAFVVQLRTAGKQVQQSVIGPVVDHLASCQQAAQQGLAWLKTVEPQM